MGGDISFQCDRLDCPDGLLSVVEMSKTESDIFWDQIMIDVCHLIVARYLQEREHVSASYRRIRFVIKFMLDIDVSKWSDEKVSHFGSFFLFYDCVKYKFTRENLKNLLDKRTDYHKYLV